MKTYLIKLAVFTAAVLLAGSLGADALKVLVRAWRFWTAALELSSGSLGMGGFHAGFRAQHTANL